MPEREERWAVFWCSLLSPLLYGEVPPEEAGRFLNALSSAEHVFPDGQRRRPSRATLWRKWKKYREGGFEALFRKPCCCTRWRASTWAQASGTIATRFANSRPKRRRPSPNTTTWTC